MPALSAPLIGLLSALLGVGLAVVVVYTMNMLMRRTELKERREETLRIRQMEMWQRDRRHKQLDSVWGDWLGDEPAPAFAGDYFHLYFDKGSDVTAEEFAETVAAALNLPRGLARIGRRGDEGRLEIRVHRASYANPLEFILLVTGATYVIGSMILWARNLNAATQEIRRSMSGTRAVQAADDESAAQHEFRAKLFDSLSAAIDDEDDEARERRIRRLEEVVEVASRHGLMAVTHTEVPAIDSRGNEVRPSPPPGELG